MMSASPRATAVRTLVSRIKGSGLGRSPRELVVNLGHHAGYPVGVGLLGPGPPKAAPAAVAVRLLCHRVVERSRHRCRLPGLDKLRGVDAQVRVNGNSQPRLPFAHTLIILLAACQRSGCGTPVISATRPVDDAVRAN